MSSCALLLTLSLRARVAPGAAVDLAALAERAVQGEAAAIAALRDAGPAGLSAFLDAADLATDRSPDEPTLAALDRICAQHDCVASRLYWFTDLEAAKREAARRGVPILSLRLLGRLDEEQSCANSRYFRLAVYSDERVAPWLRERVVLHWSSERPVPRVRVDFGDGRALEGTITGNSAHYLLDVAGRPVDVLPGLYSPRAFLSWLEETEPLARAASSLGEAGFAERLARHHRSAFVNLRARLTRDLGHLGVAEPEREVFAALARDVELPESPTAAEATALTVSKSAAEMPLLEATLEPRTQPDATLDVTALARLETWRAECGAACRELAARRAPWAAADLGAALARFEEAMARDTVANEYRLHARIHRWFAAAPRPFALAELNRRVYDELFLSPAQDPWLGLGPREVYSILAPPR